MKIPQEYLRAAIMMMSMKCTAHYDELLPTFYKAISPNPNPLYINYTLYSKKYTSSIN